MSTQIRSRLVSPIKKKNPIPPKTSITTTISAHHLFHRGIIEHHLFALWWWYSTSALWSISNNTGLKRVWNSCQSTWPILLSWQSLFTSTVHCLKLALEDGIRGIAIGISIFGLQIKSQSSRLDIPNSSKTWTCQGEIWCFLKPWDWNTATIPLLYFSMPIRIMWHHVIASHDHNSHASFDFTPHPPQKNSHLSDASNAQPFWPFSSTWAKFKTLLIFHYTDDWLIFNRC